MTTALPLRFLLARCARFPSPLSHSRSLRCGRKARRVSSRSAPSLSSTRTGGGGERQAADCVERFSARPDFQILIYPGPAGIPERIPADAPPLFLSGAADDEYVAGVLFDLTRKYRAAGASVEAHLYAQGRHAYNMGQRSPFVSIRHWPARMAEWLEDRGLLAAGK